MKKLILAVAVLVLVVVTMSQCSSCTTTTMVVPSIETSMMLDTSQKESVDKNREFTNYIRNRVVSVRRDCGLKTGIKTVSTGDGVVIALIDKEKSKPKTEKKLKVETVNGTKVIIIEEVDKKEKVEVDKIQEVIIIGPSPNRMFDGRGTGTILRSYEDSSYIITAAHVVVLDKDEKKMGLDKVLNCKTIVQLDKDADSQNNRMEAEIVAIDVKGDLAILKVKSNLKYSTDFAQEPFAGEVVWSSGYGHIRANNGLVAMSITKGTLATLNVKHGGRLAHRVTSQIFSGNSGGPIWSEDGKLIGTVLFMFGQRIDGSFMPYEGSYYIRPVNDVAILATKNKIFSEVFRD